MEEGFAVISDLIVMCKFLADIVQGWKWSNLRASGCHEYASVGVQAKGIEGSAPSTVAE